MTGADTNDSLKRFLARIVNVLHAQEIWLFGSRGRGDAHERSDWDFIAVLPDDGPDEHLDLAVVWSLLKDLRRQRVEVFPVRRSDFEEARLALGTLSQIATTEGRRVHG